MSMFGDIAEEFFALKILEMIKLKTDQFKLNTCHLEDLKDIARKVYGAMGCHSDEVHQKLMEILENKND